MTDEIAYHTWSHVLSSWGSRQYRRKIFHVSLNPVSSNMQRVERKMIMMDRGKRRKGIDGIEHKVDIKHDYNLQL